VRAPSDEDFEFKNQDNKLEVDPFKKSRMESVGVTSTQSKMFKGENS